MALAVDTLPDDPATLKAMLIAGRAEVERLRLIIKQFQRHRFERRAETCEPAWKKDPVLGVIGVQSGPP